MTAIHSIKKAIAKLPEEDRKELLRWLDEREQESWDAQIAADFGSGKLDALINRARNEAQSGKARELP